MSVREKRGKRKVRIFKGDLHGLRHYPTFREKKNRRRGTEIHEPCSMKRKSNRPLRLAGRRSLPEERDVGGRRK